MTIKIAVNGRCFNRRITGVERYAGEITNRLALSRRLISPKKSLGQLSGHVWEQIILPAQIQKSEILWSPANAGPWIVSNQVITIHDASVFDHPEWFRPSFAAWTRLSWKILSKRVKGVITVSNFSRERLIHHLQIPEQKIHVIPNGVGKPFEPQAKYKIDKVQKKYNLDKPYFLFVGTHEPRKNLAGLLQAFDKLNSATHRLAIAGENGKVFADSPPQTSSVTYTALGYVPDSDLPGLYSGASAVLTPSLYEGFGLTALEAMACGAPVIASNITVFPETVGQAALLVDPTDSNELVAAMDNILKNKTLANNLREYGLQHAAQFTWDRSAYKTQSLLESLG